LSVSPPTRAARALSSNTRTTGHDPIESGVHAVAIETSSSFYRAEIWHLGLILARYLPYRTTVGIARAVAHLYVNLRPRRREIVLQNLLPILNGDGIAAGGMSLRLFQNFAVKLADLWRYESGQSISNMFTQWTGWEHFTAAQSSKRGVLLLTPHLGNWEFGAPLLAERGVNLVVITLDEPHGKLTELRQSSRARWNIQTVVIGRDTFAFVEIIRRLEAGATVALLVDRPPATTTAMVELFGRPFAASFAAAELARASGCALLPVYLPRAGKEYAAHILPAIAYHRPALRSHEARQKLTQQIMRVFEPVIRQYPDQWYHFVPVWRR
jgi:KDO2-lipid IV(A) lauroyltransferase